MNKPCPEPRCTSPWYKHLWAHLVLEHGWQGEEAHELADNYDDIILPKHKKNNRDSN